MNQTDVIPAPQITPVVVPNSKWEQERRAFAELLPELLSTHRDNFVAIHGGAVIGSGDDRTEVAMAAYSKYGYVPIFVGLVSEQPEPAMRNPSPRIPRSDGA